MSEKVTVSIFGREYTITGGNSQEKVIKVAAHVDSKMREIDEATGNVMSQAALAILSSVNIADDYFTIREELDQSKQLCEQLEGDTQHYIQLWDEAKKAFLEYKEENTAIQKQKEELLLEITRKDKELQTLSLGKENFDEEVRQRTKEKINQVEESYKELENNYFDLQMENIRLKSEIDRLKKA